MTTFCGGWKECARNIKLRKWWWPWSRSNYFWKLLARELEEKKITYHLVNAYTVKKHREGDQLDRSKDDRRDAGQIAELSRNGHYTQTRLQKGAYEELRQYGHFV